LDNLVSTLYNNVSFDGATGVVEFTSGIPEYNYFNSGGRAKSLNYQLMIYDESSDSFQQFAMWNESASVAPCPSNVQCVQPVYSTGTQVPTSDTRAHIYDTLQKGPKSFVLALFILMVITACFFFGAVIVFRKHSLIKAAQPIIIYIRLMGVVLGAIKVFIVTLDITDATCDAGLWFGHLAFVFFFGSQVLKLTRLDALLNSGSLKRVKFTTTKAFVYFAVLVAVSIFLLLLQSFVGQP
jgi:hypothetical protein